MHKLSPYYTPDPRQAWRSKICFRTTTDLQSIYRNTHDQIEGLSFIQWMFLKTSAIKQNFKMCHNLGLLSLFGGMVGK